MCFRKFTSLQHAMFGRFRCDFLCEFLWREMKHELLKTCCSIRWRFCTIPAARRNRLRECRRNTDRRGRFVWSCSKDGANRSKYTSSNSCWHVCATISTGTSTRISSRCYRETLSRFCRVSNQDIALRAPLYSILLHILYKYLKCVIFLERWMLLPHVFLTQKKDWTTWQRVSFRT